MSRPTLSNDSQCIINICIVENNPQFLIVIKCCVTRSPRLEALFALWEDHFYTSPPHVLNSPKRGALVEVVGNRKNTGLDIWKFFLLSMTVLQYVTHNNAGKNH